LFNSPLNFFLWKNNIAASVQKTMLMFTQFSIPVVHPSFELLKRSARVLHFIAASVIAVNAWHELQEQDSSRMLAITQLIIAADIYLLIFLGGNVLEALPRINLIFRLIESLALMGIGFMLISDGYPLLSTVHFLLAGGYFFLFYREWRVVKSEAVDISQTGISLPNFIRDAEISWTDVKAIMPHYRSIVIETFRRKKIEFTLRENLNMEELQQIDEFCQKHLSSGQLAG
jgi:hypothetical protein